MKKHKYKKGDLVWLSAPKKRQINMSEVKTAPYVISGYVISGFWNGNLIQNTAKLRKRKYYRCRSFYHKVVIGGIRVAEYDHIVEEEFMTKMG
jgi:hypothetical protein